MINRTTNACLVVMLIWGISRTAPAQDMEKMWGESVVKLRAENADRGQLFDQGNYAMFIHWGLYSQLANQVDGKTYYGIGEWIMNKRMAGIPVAEYKRLAGTFHPVKFDAKAIAQLAKDAGMKYIVITSKHHDGFAMYHSKACDFNIVDATPWKKDPMKELATECREAGLGFGFYYSHNQDWTFPGGGNGPNTDADGNPATFDDYFVNKCLRMEKFGEWKGVVHVHDWQTDGKATWEVDVLEPGDYCVHLTYSGEGRLVWGVDVEGGEHIQNQQNSSHNYQEFPIGWLDFPKPGKYQVSVSCLEGDTKTASLKTIRFAPIP